MKLFLIIVFGHALRKTQSNVEVSIYYTKYTYQFIFLFF